MKFYNILLILILLLFSCSHNDVKEDSTTKASVIEEKPKKQEIIQKKYGFIYKVPPNMEESPEDAYNFQYDNLLIEKYMSYYDSDIVIAIRHSDKEQSCSVNQFAKDDQLLLRGSVKIRYEDGWNPNDIFIQKNINFKAYQFSYQYGKEKIFQRSLYIDGKNKFYVVSLSTKVKPLLDDPRSEFFWRSIEVR